MILFKREGVTANAVTGTKILVAARQHKIPIRFGCASCRCGTCAVEVISGAEGLSPMSSDETELLAKMKLTTDGSVRLSCQARISNSECTVEIDLDFQRKYSPDQGIL